MKFLRWQMIHRLLVATAGLTTVGLLVTWLAAAQVGAYQRLANRGLLASQELGLILAGEPDRPDQEAKEPAVPLAEIRNSSHTLERRLTGSTGRLLVPEGSAAMTDVTASWRNLEAVLGESGKIPPAAAQRERIAEKTRRLASDWLRLAASLADSLWSAHRLPAYAAIVACLLMVMVSLSASIESKWRSQGMASMLEGVVEQVRRGQLLDGEAATAGEGAQAGPETAGGLAQTFGMLVRVLRGQYRAMMKLLDLLTPGVAVLTGDHRILAVNESLCRLVGSERDSILGLPLAEVLPALAAAHGVQPEDSPATVHSEGDGRDFRSHLARVIPGDGDNGVLILLVEDAQEPVSRESSIQELEKLYAEVLESVPDAVVLADPNGVITDINRLAEKLLGFSREELAGTALPALQHPAEDSPEIRLEAYFASHQEWNLDDATVKARMARKDGTVFSAELKFRHLGAGGSGGYLVTVRDATQDELAELLSRDQLQVIESIARGQPLEMVLSHVTSLLEHQVAGSRCAVLLRKGEQLVPVAAPRLPAAFRQSLHKLSIEGAAGAQAGAFFEGRHIAVSDIASRPGWEGVRQAAVEHGLRAALSSPIFCSEGRVAGMIALYTPEVIEPQPAQLDLLRLASRLASVCIEQSELNSQLAYRARHDVLTGLLNRQSFAERLKHALAQAGRHKRLLGILSLDLDRFKVVNDTLGHAAGDDVIRQLAGRLAVSLRETDVVARWGGDEFVIGLLDIHGQGDAEYVAAKLLAAIRQPFSAAGRQVSVGVSIGMSVFPRDGADLSTLIRRADIAMYRAKKGGRNNLRCYSAELGETDRQRLELETELAGAVERGEITLHYQPLVDLRTGALAGLEALARWRNPRAGVVLPSDFIPIAEEVGLVIPIGGYAIHEACRQARAFERAGCGPVRIAVNVSSVQFAHPDFVDVVAEAIRQAGIDPSQLELELTESILMDAAGESASRMARLKGLGVRMCVDDFGVGYSSLGYLQRLPIDSLKIDRSFVNELSTLPRTPLLVESIVSLARSLGMRTTAEGVETLRQLRVVEKTGCDLAQGYLLGRPCPAEELLPRILSRALADGAPPRKRPSGARRWVNPEAGGPAGARVREVAGAGWCPEP